MARQLLNASLSRSPPQRRLKRLDTGSLRELSLFLVVGLMFFGGAPASTAAVIGSSPQRAAGGHHRTVRGSREARSFRRTIPDELFTRRTASVDRRRPALGWPISRCDGKAQFLQLLFEAVSAFGSVGLSTGITPSLSPVGSWLIMLTMFTGRLGPLTLAVLLAGRMARRTRVRYAQEPVRVG